MHTWHGIIRRARTGSAVSAGTINIEHANESIYMYVSKAPRGCSERLAQPRVSSARASAFALLSCSGIIYIYRRPTFFYFPALTLASLLSFLFSCWVLRPPAPWSSVWTLASWTLLFTSGFQVNSLNQTY